MSNLPPLPEGFVMMDEPPQPAALPPLPDGFVMMGEGASSEPQKPQVDALTAATLAGGNTMTLGFGDEIGAALFSPLEAAIGAYTGEDDGKGLFDRLGAGYERGLQKRRDLQAAAEEQNPIASTVGALAGGLAATGPLSKGEGAVRGLLGLGEGLGGRVAASAATGGALGAAQGFGEGEGGLANRATSAGYGLGIGLGAGTLLPLGAAAAGKGINAVRGTMAKGPIPLAAQRMLQDDLAAEGSSIAEAGARARQLGPEAMLADTSETLRLRAEQIAQSDNPGRAGVIGAMKDRGVGAKGRLNSAYDASLGQTPDIQQTLDDLLTTRSQASKPLYDKALARPVEWDKRLDAFIKDPIVKSGLARGVEIQRLESLADDVPFNPTELAIKGFDDAGEPIIEAIPNFKTLNVVKKGLDALVDDNKTEFGKLTQRGVAIDKVRAAFLAKLDDINPDYAAARSAWAGPSQTIDAFEDGRKLLGAKVHPDTLRKDFNRLSDAEKDAFRLGTRAAVDEAMGRVKNGALKGRQLLDTDFNERKLTTILGDDEANKLIAALDGEEQMAATANQALANSATARRQDNPFRKNGRTAGEQAPGVVRNLANLRFGDAAARVGEYGMGALDKRARDSLGKSLGPALTARGAERDALVTSLEEAQKRLAQIAQSNPTNRQLIELLLRGGATAGVPSLIPGGSR